MIENSDNAAASALWDTTGGLRPLITQRGDSRRPLAHSPADLRGYL